ncbi:MAG: hypothetical protein ACTHXO_10435 [Actinomycetaceae bacterium]
MVGDDHLRPLVAFFRAVPAPTSVFAHLIDARVSGKIANSSWGTDNHAFGGDATRAERTVDDLDLDTDLMRRATGGR